MTVTEMLEARPRRIAVLAAFVAGSVVAVVGAAAEQGVVLAIGGGIAAATGLVSMKYCFELGRALDEQRAVANRRARDIDALLAQAREQRTAIDRLSAGLAAQSSLQSELRASHDRAVETLGRANATIDEAVKRLEVVEHRVPGRRFRVVPRDDTRREISLGASLAALADDGSGVGDEAPG